MQGLQPAADAKGVQLTRRSSRPAVGVLAMRSRLQQVSGTCCTTPSSSRRQRAASRFASIAQTAALQIASQDNGQGISPEFLPHVFERFRQQDSSTTRESSGLGLGLSIAKHLVELHGGTITASSPGMAPGATFVVTVPAALPAGRPRRSTPPARTTTRCGSPM